MSAPESLIAESAAAVPAVVPTSLDSQATAAESATSASPRSHRALTGLFVLAVLYTLHAASGLVLPLVLVLLFTLVLSPVVRALQRWYVPRALGAALVVIGLMGSIGYGVYALSEPAADWLARAPGVVRDIERKIAPLRAKVAEVNKAAQQVERKITEVPGDARVPTTQLAAPSLRAKLFDNLLDVAAGAVVLFFLLFFLLAAEDTFLRKLVRVTPALNDRKNIVGMVREIEYAVSSYLFNITLINIGLGVAVGIMLALLGMPNPALWGVTAAVLNFIPYLGAAITLVILAIAAVITYDQLVYVLVVPGIFLVMTTLESDVITPWIIGRRLSLNAVMIAISLIFWGWMWGAIGMLVAVPILVTAKIICDRVPHLKPYGEFLGQ